MSANTYETVFIAEPEISTDQVDQLINKVKQAVTSNQGAVTGEDRWGRRRLAYPIHGHREGFYVILGFNAAAGAVSAIEHLYNVTDSVIRHMTIRVIKSKKTFRPRKERPAGHAEARHGGRSSGSRPRSEAAAPAVPGPVADASGTGMPPHPKSGGATAAPPAAAAPVPTAEGGTPA